MKWKSSFKSHREISGLAIPQLLEAARYGDEIAFKVIVERTHQKVKSYVSKYGSSADADDLIQECYLRAIKSKTFYEARSIEAYMIHIAKFVCADYARSRQKARQITTTYNEDFSEHATDTMFDDEVASMDLIKSSVPDPFREAFILTQVIGLTYEECGDILDVPVGTVRSRVSRARNFLIAATSDDGLYQAR